MTPGRVGPHFHPSPSSAQQRTGGPQQHRSSTVEGGNGHRDGRDKDKPHMGAAATGEGGQPLRVMWVFTLKGGTEGEGGEKLRFKTNLVDKG